MKKYAILNDDKKVLIILTPNTEDENITDLEEYYSNIYNCICKKTCDETYGGKFYSKTKNTTNQNSPFRKNYAGIGYTYDEQRDAFIPPTPFASWVLDEFSCLWITPIPYPNDANLYYWNEETLSWDLANT
jgi:hypothetical protein